MLIKIERIESHDICEEFVNDSEILSCRKIKVIDSPAKAKCTPCFIDFDKQLDLILEEETIAYKTYKDRTNGDIYTFREYNPQYDEIGNLTGDDSLVKLGWNKVEILPAVFHYEYWIELPSITTDTRMEKTYWNPGYDIKSSAKPNKVRVTEETYNKITQHI